MATGWAPEQGRLTKKKKKKETITSFESWKQNLFYILTLDPNFAPFLANSVTWSKWSSQKTNRDFTDDSTTVATERRRTAAKKAKLLDLMLGQIANYCPVMARNSITKKTTSLDYIWQAMIMIICCDDNMLKRMEV